MELKRCHDQLIEPGNNFQLPTLAGLLLAERHFEHKWALELLLAAQKDLLTIYSREEKTALFEALAPALLDSKEWQGHHEAAALGMSEGAAKVALHQLRQRYREALLAKVAETVKEEVAYLLGLFGS